MVAWICQRLLNVSPTNIEPITANPFMIVDLLIDSFHFHVEKLWKRHHQSKKKLAHHLLHQCFNCYSPCKISVLTHTTLQTIVRALLQVRLWAIDAKASWNWNRLISLIASKYPKVIEFFQFSSLKKHLIDMNICTVNWFLSDSFQIT